MCLKRVNKPRSKPLRVKFQTQSNRNRFLPRAEQTHSPSPGTAWFAKQGKHTQIKRHVLTFDNLSRTSKSICLITRGAVCEHQETGSRGGEDPRSRALTAVQLRMCRQRDLSFEVKLKPTFHFWRNPILLVFLHLPPQTGAISGKDALNSKCNSTNIMTCCSSRALNI